MTDQLYIVAWRGRRAEDKGQDRFATLIMYPASGLVSIGNEKYFGLASKMTWGQASAVCELLGNGCWRIEPEPAAAETEEKADV